MGTHYYLSVILEGKHRVCQYGQRDGLPTHVGVALLSFVRDADLAQLKTALANTVLVKTPKKNALSWTGSNKDGSAICRRVCDKEVEVSKAKGEWVSSSQVVMQMLEDSEISISELDILVPYTQDTGAVILPYIYYRDLNLPPLELYVIKEEFDPIAAFAACECLTDVPGWDIDGYYVIDFDKNAIFMNYRSTAWGCNMSNLPHNIELEMALFEERCEKRKNV